MRAGHAWVALYFMHLFLTTWCADCLCTKVQVRLQEVKKRLFPPPAAAAAAVESHCFVYELSLVKMREV